MRKDILSRAFSEILTPEQAVEKVRQQDEREALALLERRRRKRDHGEVKGGLLFALEEIVRADKDGQPMEAEDIKELADMARRYLDGLDQYPGELGSADLLKQKRDQIGRSNRDAALHRLAKLSESPLVL